MDTYQFHPYPILRRHHEVSSTLDNFIVFIPENDNKEQYSSNCNRPLYLAGVINASVAIIPRPLHVDMSNVSNTKIF